LQLCDLQNPPLTESLVRQVVFQPPLFAVRNILDRASCRDLHQQKGERFAAVPHLKRAALASFKAHHSGQNDNDIKSLKDR